MLVQSLGDCDGNVCKIPATQGMNSLVRESHLKELYSGQTYLIIEQHHGQEIFDQTQG